MKESLSVPPPVGELQHTFVKVRTSMIHTLNLPLGSARARITLMLGGLAAMVLVFLLVSTLVQAQAASPIEYAENDTGPVATFTAVDPEGKNIVWSLVEEGASDFDIEGGVLTFKSSPDFEDPKGSTSDNSNTYSVTVQASDGRTGADAMDTEVVTVEVTNVDEPGTVTLSTLQPQVEVALIATFNDPDGPHDGAGVFTNSVTWEWFRGNAEIAGAAAATYTPMAGDVGFVLTAKATYKDDENDKEEEDDENTKSKEAASDYAVRAKPATNFVPAFPQTSPTRSVAENTPSGRNVGAPVAASDQGDVLTYSIDSATTFDIDRTTGQLKTKAALDFEGGTITYTVTVTATDPFGAPAMAVVTITVTDVDEDPAITTKAETHTAISFMETGTAITTRPSDLCSHRPREFDDQLGCVGV